MEVQYQPLSKKNRTIYYKILLLLGVVVLMSMVIVISSIAYIIYVENASKSEENYGFSMFSLMGWSSRNYLPKRWFEEKNENEYSISTARKLNDEAEILENFSNNGLALTPLMGWSSRKHLMSRGSFGDEIENDYSTSEKVIENTAEILHRKATPKLAIITYNRQSWSAPVRNKDGDIEPDHRRFPKGIHNLAKN
ncbi:uncharacterized protein LOC120349017, partial [Nilaparvata lugens]|uniref:uncharacterized protein LOC120349017 n=1 Tax=Nilaparvata lugens TaxID=108931 RepID=UPI00193E240E